MIPYATETFYCETNISFHSSDGNNYPHFVRNLYKVLPADEKKSTFKKTKGGGGHAIRISLKLSIYISLKLKMEFIENWATLIFSLQKPWIRIISHMLHPFLHFSKAIDVISYIKKRISWESEKIDFKNFKFQRKGTDFFWVPNPGLSSIQGTHYSI